MQASRAEAKGGGVVFFRYFYNDDRQKLVERTAGNGCPFCYLQCATFLVRSPAARPGERGALGGGSDMGLRGHRACSST